MSEQKRITVEEVKAAYAKTGAVPTRRSYYGKYGFDSNEAVEHCCGIGVLAIAGGLDPAIESIRCWATEKYGHYYRCGFEYGFDGDYISNYEGLNFQQQGQYDLGYAAGVACAAAVFDAQGAPSCPSK